MRQGRPLVASWGTSERIRAVIKQEQKRVCPWEKPRAPLLGLLQNLREGREGWDREG